MKQFNHIKLLILLVLIISCTNKPSTDMVSFDDSFLGARLDSIIKLDTNTYEAYINPAFEPVNKSPWFAFGVSSNIKKTIVVKLNYGKYEHRYIPKISTDKKSWNKIDSKNIKIDTLVGTAIIKLQVSPKKIFVSAQELESSKDTYLWMNNLLSTHPNLKTVVAGKTALNNDNYCIELENESIKNAVVLIARQHPPEIPGGTIGFKAFFETIMSTNKTAQRFRKLFNIYTFPLLNPDGADLGNWRHNANGVDLNRDWVDFTQPETKMVKEYIDKKVNNGEKIRFALDFHTSYSGPYLLVLDSINETKTKNIIPSWIKNIEANSSFIVESRKRSQKLPYSYNYFYNTFNCEAVTYEDGDEIDRDVIKKRAQIYAQEFIKTMLLKYDDNEFKN